MNKFCWLCVNNVTIRYILARYICGCFVVDTCVYRSHRLNIADAFVIAMWITINIIFYELLQQYFRMFLHFSYYWIVFEWSRKRRQWKEINEIKKHDDHHYNTETMLHVLYACKYELWLWSESCEVIVLKCRLRSEQQVCGNAGVLAPISDAF